LFIFTASAFQINAQRSTGTLSIDFIHFVDNQPLKFDSAVYRNELGQSYTISNFKYYISAIELVTEQGTKFSSGDHFLINEEDERSKKISLNKIPAGKYTAVQFIIGVDSLHNCSGAQTGALDPANTMFWAWNSGYIFLKLEGKSSSSSATGKIIEYHIGGYKAPANCIRSVHLKPGQEISINDKGNTEIQINVNIAEILRGPQAIDFRTLPAVADFHNASVIADNYKDMFTISKISYAH